MTKSNTVNADKRPTVLFFSSAFCDPCATARDTLDQVSKLVTQVDYAELDVARHSDEAERAGIVSTPTIVIVAANGDEVFRAQGAPTVNQMLVALAKAVWAPTRTDC
ncbi:thioredoxin family protein [Salinibacterium sp. PAMC 21357]|uniref:thioredoxin family protein n=1 Tax=Salinibacterium sp. PAMC 21357 TaxID=1112215 RepID=UPI000288E604|nr:thioredoxin family protein [Salinibacterium sp. PAMC 21357]